MKEVQEWDVFIRNNMGVTAPEIQKAPKISYDSDTVEAQLIEASVEWNFEIDSSSGPFTLLLPGDKQIPLNSFLDQENN